MTSADRYRFCQTSALSRLLCDQVLYHRGAANYANKVEAEFVAEGVRKLQHARALMAELQDIFLFAQAANKEVDRINGSAPASEHRRLRHVEETARGLDVIPRDQSVIRDTHLIDWDGKIRRRNRFHSPCRCKASRSRVSTRATTAGAGMKF